MHRYLFNKPSDQTIIELIQLGGLLMKEINEFCFLFLSVPYFTSLKIKKPRIKSQKVIIIIFKRSSTLYLNILIPQDLESVFYMSSNRKGRLD